MPCPISLLFINLHGSQYLVAAQLGPGGGGRSSAARGEHRDLGRAARGVPRSSPETRGAPAGVCLVLQPCESESSPGRRGKGGRRGAQGRGVHREGVWEPRQ